MYVKITSSEMVQRKSNDKKWQNVSCVNMNYAKIYILLQNYSWGILYQKTTHSYKKVQRVFSDCFHNKMPCAGLI